MTDIAERLRAATFTRGRSRGGAGGQTIEATMRSTFHEISAWDLDEAADEIDRLRAELALWSKGRKIADVSPAELAAGWAAYHGALMDQLKSETRLDESEGQR